ncbi:MAG TPA: ABC transporter substrate-binding protein [Syntrophorhabdales bacterium]|nr:ABC transporter substrate-binding protein [Syntrophorhabdales bacterium]
MSSKKGKWIFVCLVVFIAVFAMTASDSLAAEKSPIKVGLLLSYTGIAPLQAKGSSDGAEFAFDEIHRRAGGRAIQVLKEDSELNPTVALTKVRRLIEEQKVNFIVGPVSSAEALAIYDYVLKSNVIWIIPCAFTRELTSPEKANEKMFRTTETSDQGNYPMGRWVMKNTNWRNVVVTGQDYKAGHDSVDAFKAGFTEAGGKILKDVYPKMGTMDFAPFLSTIDVKGADAVMAWTTGTDAIRFVQQYEEFGLKKRLPLFGGQVALVDDPYLSQIGDAALGILSQSHYPPTLDTPRNRAFVKAYTAKYGETPSRYSEYGYTAAKMIIAGIEGTKGNVEDVSPLAKEIKRASSSGKIETPAGTLAIDQYNQRIIDVYIVKVEKKEGKLVNAVIDKLGKVSQVDTWKWWNK